MPNGAVRRDFLVVSLCARLIAGWRDRDFLADQEVMGVFNALAVGPVDSFPFPLRAVIFFRKFAQGIARLYRV